MADNFVSRGGVKLQAALDRFQINVQDKVILDVGSSTGGFVDCLLQNGAKKVYAVDTAYGELAWKLRNDPRVVVMERTNILHMQHLRGESKVAAGSHLGGEQLVDLTTIDAGWTKLELILPIVRKFLKPEGVIIALLKPHYEAEKRDLVKGVLPENIAKQVKDEVVKRIGNLGFKVQDQMDSPILGGAGNKEYLLYLTF
ncbi:MAG: TlyA family rRNA (cytidine-2'-O)-methyltransferase [Candidatus Daviesbacteria bacterium]|nr:TlyA family rRNA (cytidine-2'-O)-methyltransferase [Candidatus Daviesbacteria bacterium]